MSEGRVAVLTGAFGGIGVGISDELLARGYRVAAVDRAVPEVAVATDRLLPISSDLVAEDAAEQVTAATLQAFGSVDVLVNCAGVLLDRRVEVMSESDFRFVYGTNLTASYRLTAAMLPHLRAAGAGRIISLASRAWLGTFGSTNYAASKGGLVGMTRALALAEGSHGVTANAIAPGFIATPMAAHLAPVIPVGRAGTPHDVARTVSFLASEDAGYITGQTLVVCGGRSLQP